MAGWMARLVRAVICPAVSAHPPGDRPPLDEEFEDESSFDFIFDQVVGQLQFQNQLWDIVDGRLRLILGVIGIILAALLQGITRGLEPPRQPLSLITGASAIVAV